MSNVNIKFKKDKHFLPCYHHLIPEILLKKKDLVEAPQPPQVDIDFLYGGRDSGKSRFVASILILCCLYLPYFRCVLVRKVYGTILGSQWQLIKDICQGWKIDHLFKFTEGGCKIECLLNGNSFEGRGMDDPGKLKSFSNPSHCWVEEGSDLELDDFIIIMTSLRYNEGRVKLWYTYNPEVDGEYTEHWLYKNFYNGIPEIYTVFHSTWTLGKGGKEVTKSIAPAITHTQTTATTDLVTFTYRSTHTTYHHNPYCSPERRAILEALGELNTYYYNVFTLGRWGNKIVTDPFAFAYNIKKHRVATKFRPDLITVLSFDFNRNPITCGVYQHDGDNIYGIESIKLVNSDIYALCAHIKPKYGNAVLLITGDATGQGSSAMVKDELTYYKIIKQELDLADTQFRVPSVNPSIEDNRVLLNAVLHKCQVHLDPVECAPLHFDLSNVGVNDMGKIDKGSRSNPKKRADHMDNFRYYLNMFFSHVLKM